MSDDQTTSGTRALSDATRSLADVALAVDGLVVITRAGLRRAILLVILCGVLLAVSTVAILVLLFRTDTQVARFDDLVSRLGNMSEEQTKLRHTAEQTKEKVEAAAEAADSKPSVEIVPAASAKGKPAAAVVVIKAAKSSPKTSPPTAIEIPVKLPEGSHVSVTDGGAQTQGN